MKLLYNVKEKNLPFICFSVFIARLYCSMSSVRYLFSIFNFSKSTGRRVFPNSCRWSICFFVCRIKRFVVTIFKFNLSIAASASFNCFSANLHKETFCFNPSFLYTQHCTIKRARRLTWQNYPQKFFCSPDQPDSTPRSQTAQLWPRTPWSCTSSPPT